MKKTSTLFYYFFAFLFISLSLFFTFSLSKGVPPDEGMHLGLVKVFSNPKTFIFLKDTSETYKFAQFGVASRSIFTYHFLMGKLLIINSLLNLTSDVTFLRLINVLLGAVFLYLVYLFLKEVKSNWFEKVFVFLMILFTTMLAVLFGSVSWDNLTNILALSSFILLVKFSKKPTWTLLLSWILISGLGALTKYSYLPLIFFQLIPIIYYAFKKNLIKLNLKKKSVKFKPLKSKRVVFVLFALNFILLTLGIYSYGINLYKYQSLVPKCTQMLTHEQCLASPIYQRSLKFKKMNRGKKMPQFSLISFKDYYYFTYNKLTTNMYDLFTHKYLSAHKNTYVFLPLLIFLGFFLSIYYSKNKKINHFLALIIFLYFSVLATKLYFSYLNTNSYGIATQGRYLFPIITPLYYLMGYGYEKLLKNKYLKIGFLVFLVILLNQLIYRPLFHEMRMNKQAYGNQEKILYFINQNFYYKLPRIKMFEI